MVGGIPGALFIGIVAPTLLGFAILALLIMLFPVRPPGRLSRHACDDVRVTVTVAVLGLGEAGSHYAADLLAAGLPVTGYDPAVISASSASGARGQAAGPGSSAAPRLDGLRLATSPAEAVTGAQIVLSLTPASAAVEVAASAAAGLGPAEAVYADLSTASPGTKQAVADAVSATGAAFVDAAVLAPVPRAGLRTPLLLAGPGREQLAAFLAPLGVPVEDAGAEPGAAAGAKLLRSVFMKGLAAVVGEALEAATAAGQADWLRRQIAAELEAADDALITRLLDGSVRHAARRADEMAAAVAHLDQLRVRTDLSRATRSRLTQLAEEHGDRRAPRRTVVPGAAGEVSMEPGTVTPTEGDAGGA